MAAERVGTMIRMVRNPAIMMLLKNSGMDFCFYDLEHGFTSLETLSDSLILARSIGMDCYVRVPELGRSFVSGVLDAGASGVMVPMVETSQEAQKLVQWSKFPPLGGRGFGSSGGHSGYLGVAHDDVRQFMDAANQETLSIAQIETERGTANADCIAAVDGIDALLIGPNDLSISLGIPGQLHSPEVGECIARVAEAARKHGKVFGIHGPERLLREWIPRGCRMIVNGLDTNILAKGFRAITQDFKENANGI